MEGRRGELQTNFTLEYVKMLSNEGEQNLKLQ